MDNNNLVEIIKRRLRLSTDAFNDDIIAYAAAAVLELERAGSGKLSADNAIVLVAIEMFEKYMFNYETEGDKYLAAFEGMRDAFALTGGDFFEGNEK